MSQTLSERMDEHSAWMQQEIDSLEKQLTSLTERRKDDKIKIHSLTKKRDKFKKLLEVIRQSLVLLKEEEKQTI